MIKLLQLSCSSSYFFPNKNGFASSAPNALANNISCTVNSMLMAKQRVQGHSLVPTTPLISACLPPSRIGIKRRACIELDIRTSDYTLMCSSLLYGETLTIRYGSKC